MLVYLRMFSIVFEKYKVLNYFVNYICKPKHRTSVSEKLEKGDGTYEVSLRWCTKFDRGWHNGGHFKSGGENILHHFHSYIVNFSYLAGYVSICALLNDLSQVYVL